MPYYCLWHNFGWIRTRSLTSVIRMTVKFQSSRTFPLGSVKLTVPGPILHTKSLLRLIIISSLGCCMSLKLLFFSRLIFPFWWVVIFYSWLYLLDPRRWKKIWSCLHICQGCDGIVEYGMLIFHKVYQSINVTCPKKPFL